MLISHGLDIKDARELFNALWETNTSIKVFFVNSEPVEQALERMPSNLTAVPGTMRIHQLFFWPVGEDVLWYLFDDVLELIPPPKPVASRHMDIEKEVWARLSD
ncbi:hypothetical protein KUCAC02_001588 [Chaenocephalus aceratus]|uniref:Uncharacterized protein n=1 Tax=Chaenocephalus aceratus TaxID=36190 RepID=A0ACB9XR58_CHAAC|nr:hypothetical protein KUCAC02_001588 [Chaenocephalus aceratus]